jgi:hypothetical protein
MIERIGVFTDVIDAPADSAAGQSLPEHLKPARGIVCSVLVCGVLWAMVLAFFLG